VMRKKSMRLRGWKWKRDYSQYTTISSQLYLRSLPLVKLCLK